ncbi:MAG: tRNA lysidine(34) synthetase TilS [Clostridiales bacterium]|nr:tRNA lysidine(34) synthetase TilS [Clostridiales bacterium]
MEELLRNVFHTIEEYHMIEPGMRVIAGVSGGADSVCLLDVLRQYRRKAPFELFVVHVEHGLRGQESRKDAAFVQELCEEWEIPCRVAAALVSRKAEKEGLSIEEAAREERYRIFEETGREWNADRIAVAHNRNDQAETVLWNLARGSGLKGLGGIRPVQGRRIRPLLFTDRADIEDYLRKAGLTWRMDRTNLETEYTRNRIRLSLLPQMEKDLNPQAAEHIAGAADRLRGVQDYIDRVTKEAAARCILVCGSSARPSAVIQLEPYKKEDRLIRQELLKCAVEVCADGLKDIGAVHLHMLERLADMDCGKRCDLPGGICAVREQGILRIGRKDSLTGTDAAGGGYAAVAIPVPGKICPAGIFDGISVTTERMPNAPELKKYFLEEKKYTKWISYDTIKNNLLLRNRRPGDYLVVNAQGGTKKLKEYLIEQKIPRDMRDQVLLLADGSHILWVIGWRISEAAKVTDETRQVLKVTCRGGRLPAGEREHTAGAKACRDRCDEYT